MKALLIILVVDLYAAYASIFGSTLVTTINPALTDPDNIGGWMWMGFVFAAVPLEIAILVLSIISGFKEKPCPYHFIGIIKLILIPFYLVNFVMCILVALLMIHPLLFLAWPFVVAIMIGLTYFSMLATSGPDIAYLIRSLILKKESLGGTLPHIILQFVFVADVVSATILLAKASIEEKEKKAEGKAVEPTDA
ncbi:MAG: hypothetical protein BWY98_00414 [Tenericutes bacterium ADurb.BinA155]|jgi:hypothetical protein|nr:MAG: hypothetical protein BWY98_00414 [Tenericutes bacterium ADurb.BinA155]